MDYESGMKYKDIAAKYNVSLNTVKSWRARNGWARGAPEAKKGAPEKQKRVHPKTVPKAVTESDATDKQKLFAMLYLQRFNGTWAYMKAYGVDAETARASAPRLLANVSVKRIIDELKAEQAAELHMTQMDVLQDLAKQARADIGDYVEFGSDAVVEIKDGEPTGITYQVDRVHLKAQSDVDTSLIKSVAIDKGFVKLELYDKQKAMDMLLKNLPNAAVTRRAKAEADLAEYKRDLMTGDGDTTEGTVIIDDIGSGDQAEDDHQD